ncbi:AvrD family protein [Curtobacterium flaccumfaciens]|uniref:AvrD family protein n=1 Tax=Curtobacterium flaccumfaciens TaxID=2035 RepID=UPI003993C6E6
MTIAMDRASTLTREGTTFEGPLAPGGGSTDGFDTLLGPAGTRYLGSGHRRVQSSLTPSEIADDGAFIATARLAYPEDWSIKSGRRLRPHLSTIDALTIASRAHDEVVAAWCPWLGTFPLEQSLRVRAGARPVEDLDEVAVRSVVGAPSRAGAVVVEHTIGSFTVTSEWAAGPQEFDDDPAGVVADVRLVEPSAVACRYTRSSSIAPMSFLEVLTLTAQMSQVVLYGGDAATRERSNNMWMRRASFERLQTRAPRQQELELRLHNRRVLVVNGEPVETAEVLAENVFGVYVTASLAMRP